VNLPQQPVAEREFAGLDAPKPVIHGSDVVRGLLDIVKWDARNRLVLEQKKVGERGLGPFDLRGQHGLLADVRVQELTRFRKEQRHRVEPSQRLVGLVQQALRRMVDLERRLRRQRGGHERRVAIPAALNDHQPPCSSARDFGSPAGSFT
jgi:hypothetical protein